MVFRAEKMAVINTRLLFVHKYTSKFYYRDVKIFTTLQDAKREQENDRRTRNRKQNPTA